MILFVDCIVFTLESKCIMFVTCPHHVTIKFAKKLKHTYFFFDYIATHVLTISVSSNKVLKMMLIVIVDLI
jgi:hypothetical protein